MEAIEMKKTVGEYIGTVIGFVLFYFFMLVFLVLVLVLGGRALKWLGYLFRFGR